MDETRFKIVNGYQWPINDRDCAAVVFKTTHDMDYAMELCKHKRIAVQAGGNCGVWPNYLADHFESVITFEPDPTNFECLVANAKKNVSCYNYGLGNENIVVSMVREQRNIGAHYINDASDKEGIQIKALDSMMLLPYLDYVCLDIEGYEMMALEGMYAMLDMHRPVIQIEDKGLSEKYGVKKGDAERWLAEHFGYEVKYRVARDVILACP